jgi:putative transposase
MDTEIETRKISYKRRVSEFIVDETQIKVGNDYFFWIWIAIEPKDKSILDIYFSAAERTMFVVAEHFLQNLINKYGKHQISTDGSTWYPYACKFLKIGHYLHSSFEKSIIERTIQYIKDRTENFEYDYFSCNKNKCT